MDYSHEFVMPSEDFPFKIFIFEGKDGNYVREKHWHRSVEIFAVFKGELDFYIDEESYHLQSDNFMLVNSNEIHSIHSPLPNQTIVLQIPLSVFENYFTGEQFISFSHSLGVQDEYAMKLITEMYETYSQRKYGYELKVQSNFFLLVYLLVTRYIKTEVNQSLIEHSRKLNRLSAITAYLRDNHTEELSLESVAGTFGYSPAYLSRIFQKYAHINYRTYLQNVRVEYAYKELANTENTISDISINHGFPNSKAFAKAFRKKYGILPSDYRKSKKTRK